MNAILNIKNLIANIPQIIEKFKEGMSMHELASNYDVDQILIEEIIRLSFSITFDFIPGDEDEDED